jgi:tRNA (adenine57-N1/adenine58-N1)-methyltransferase catalytic subunit
MMKEGQLVYLLDQRGRKYWMNVRPEMVKIPGLGVLDGSRLMALESGSKISFAGIEFYVLVPGNPELMESVDRSAQVIIAKDAATILFNLDVKSGDVVLEAGLGSAALTMPLLNVVRPAGKVISVELREDFALKGRRNVERTGFQANWQLKIGDVRTIDVGERVDSVILDMPAPWEAVDNVKRFLKPGGRFCGYVPNTNQLESTVRKLRESGFIEVVALENIQRLMDVHEGGVRPSFDMLGHTGYLVFGRMTPGDPQG